MVTVSPAVPYQETQLELLFSKLGPMNYWESFELVLVMISLLFLSSQIVMVVCKKSQIFVKCNSVEKLTYSLLIGMAVLTLALETTYLIGPFLKEISWGITLTSLLVCLLLYKREILQFPKRLVGIQNKKMSFKFLPKKVSVSTVLLIVTVVLMGGSIFLASSIVDGNYGSTNFDASLHTLVIKSYLDQNKATERPLPYYDFIIRYPRGPFIIGAYAVTVTSAPIHKIVALMTVFFTFLVSLSLYALGKTMFKSQTAGLLVFVLGTYTQSFWGIISWGGLPFLMGLSTVTIALGFTLRFLENASRIEDSLIFSLVLYITLLSYPTAPLFVFVWLVLCLAGIAFRAFFLSKNKEVKAKVKKRIALACLAVFLAIALSATFLQTVNNELNSWLVNPQCGSFPEPVTASEQGMREAERVISTARRYNPLNPLDIFHFSQNYSHWFFLASAAPLVIVILWVIRDSIKRNPQGAEELIPHHQRVFLAYLLFVLIIICLQQINNIRPLKGFPLGDLIPPVRVFQSLFILLSLLSVAVIWGLVSIVIMISKNVVKICKEDVSSGIVLSLPRRFVHVFRHKRVLFPFLLLASLTFSLIFVTYSSGTLDPGEPINLVAKSRIRFEKRSRLSSSDLALMNWMKSNIEPDQVIFINWQDGGQYVSAVAGLKAIYVVSPLYISARYQQALYCLILDPFNKSAIETVVYYYGASYIFIGARANGELQWNPAILELSPYFELVQRSGDSYLFRILLA